MATVDTKRLRRFSFLASLGDDELQSWLPKFGEETRPGGEVIFSEGDVGNRFYLIEAGQVSVERNLGGERRQFLGYVGAGEFIGEESLINNTPRYATICAVSQLSLIYLNKSDFLDLYETVPAVGAAIRAVVAQRLRRRTDSFPSKRDEEALLMSTHRHFIWFLIRIVPWSLLALLLLAAAIVIGGEALLPLDALLALVYAVGFAWFYIDWRNDWFVLSSRRVLHHEKIIFLFERVEEAPLEKIQNVTSDVLSFAGNIFDFGNVEIQTAAGGGRILFDMIPKARIMRDAIQLETQRVAERTRQEEITQKRQLIRKELQREIHLTHEPPPPPEVRAGVNVREQSGILRRTFGRIGIIPPTFLRKGEQIIWRRHVLLLYRDVALPVLALIILVPFTLLMVFGDLAGFRLPLPLTLLIAVVGTLLSLIWLWYRYRDWENDIYVLTPDSLVDSNRKPLWLQERVRVAGLAQVQNVTFERKTLIENILNFGTVVIQTAGEHGNLTFEAISHPAEAQAEISDALQRFRARQALRDREARRHELLDWFSEYHKLQTEPPQPPAPV